MKKSSLTKHAPNISLIVIGIVFILLVVTNFISNTIIMLLHRNRLLSMHPGNPIPFLVQNAFLSILIGMLLTLLICRLALRPIHTIIQAIHDVSRGDFDTKLNIEYPREFKELSQSFNQMTKELSGIEILRSDFINDFSHEFKTPMMSILGFAKMLKNDALSAAERNEYLDIIIDESLRLTTLSTNILNLSKVESMTLKSDFTTFHLSEQIREALVQLASRWEQKHIEFQLQLPEISICGNEPLLKQVWINLIDNAIKFSPEYSRISISLLCNDHSVLFTIQDHGIGMSREVQEKIFNKFYQGDPSRASQGNGLGLSLVRQIITLHNGSVSVESSPQKGSTFTVVLPL